MIIFSAEREFLMKIAKKSRLYDVSQIQWNNMMFSRTDLQKLLVPLMLQ